VHSTISDQYFTGSELLFRTVLFKGGNGRKWQKIKFIVFTRNDRAEELQATEEICHFDYRPGGKPFPPMPAGTAVKQEKSRHSW
jgi:hypothetical protein